MKVNMKLPFNEMKELDESSPDAFIMTLMEDVTWTYLNLLVFVY